MLFSSLSLYLLLLFIIIFVFLVHLFDKVISVANF